jgi:predicted transcriptional regulator
MVSDRTGGTDDRYNRIISIEDESMVTRLAVDKKLLQEAIESDSQATIETVVETALREYIRRRQQLKEAVMIGAAEADRGELLDGETAMQNLQQKLNQWRAEAEA